MRVKISANKLADFILAKTPERRRSIVRQLIRAKESDGFPQFYQRFRTPAKNFLIGDCQDIGIIHQAIASIDNRATPEDSDWHKTDTRITKQSLQKLLTLVPKIQAQNVQFLAPPPKVPMGIEYEDVVISVRPNLIVRGERNGIPLYGAARFYLAKESRYQLGRDGSELVATMEYLWAVENATGARAPDVALCMVFEMMQQRITSAPTDCSRRAAQIERGCRDFEIMWRELSSNEAA